MERKNNIIRLNESELHQLIESAAIKVINEGRWGDMAKKVGKGVAKGALYGALATGGAAAGLYGLDKGLEQQEKYEQSLNQQARQMAGPTKQDVTNWCIERGLDPNNQHNIEQAYDYFDEAMQDPDFKFESKKHNKPMISEAQIAKAIRKSLKKILA